MPASDLLCTFRRGPVGAEPVKDRGRKPRARWRLMDVGAADQARHGRAGRYSAQMRLSSNGELGTASCRSANRSQFTTRHGTAGVPGRGPCHRSANPGLKSEPSSGHRSRNSGT